jgi:hypothetical protein
MAAHLLMHEFMCIQHLARRPKWPHSALFSLHVHPCKFAYAQNAQVAHRAKCASCSAKRKAQAAHAQHISLEEMCVPCACAALPLAFSLNVHMHFSHGFSSPR